MRKRSTDGDRLDATALADEVAALRAELDRLRRRDEEQRRLDGVSVALVGEFDPHAVETLAERWATAALGRPCSIVHHAADDDAGADVATISLGDGVGPARWLVISGRSLGAEDEDAAREVASRVGRALDAAHRVAAQADAMRTLERSLLPDALLTIAGVQLASRYLPARGSNDVGGDFYDAVRAEGSLTLIVGDVQGKGVEAATLTALARHTLRAGALAAHGPAHLLAQLNTALVYGQREREAAGHGDQVRYVTAAAARLSPSAGGGVELVVARAGQPPPLIVRSDGRVESLEPRGVLLGVVESPDYDEATAHLDVGDTLVLYTDGVIEQRAGGHQALSEQHLGMLIRNRRGVVDAEAIAQLIEDTVHLVAPEEIRDDVALLVACVTRDVSSPS